MQPQPMSAITGIPRSSTLPTLLVDGLVTGMWERRARGRRIQITVEAIQCTHLRAAQAAGGWAAGVGAFYGADASLAIGVLT
jgi:hypothetical protein